MSQELSMTKYPGFRSPEAGKRHNRFSGVEHHYNIDYYTRYTPFEQIASEMVQIRFSHVFRDREIQGSRDRGIEREFLPNDHLITADLPGNMVSEAELLNGHEGTVPTDVELQPVYTSKAHISLIRKCTCLLTMLKWGAPREAID